MSLWVATSCVTLLLATAVGQSAPATTLVRMAHVEGTIDSMTNGAIPHVTVSFQDEHENRTVVVDDKGFYQIDLPVGIYTMTAELPPVAPGQISRLTKYVRFFQVKSPSPITLNGVLYGTHSCDGVWGGGGQDQERVELYKDSCGGDDSFLVTSKDGVPLHLDFHYLRRERSDGNFTYSSLPAFHRPVLAIYNLFTLQADSVVYDKNSRRITASGEVVIEDESGQVHAESAAFKIQDGKAIRIR